MLRTEEMIREELMSRVNRMLPRVEKRASVLENRLVSQLFSLILIIDEQREVNKELRTELWELQAQINNGQKP